MTRTPAARPAPRTVQVEIPDGDFAGWSATVRADFPARLLLRLQQTENPAEVLSAFQDLVLDHNMPDSSGKIAKSLLDIDPYEGVVAVVGAAFDAIGKLPPR